MATRIVTTEDGTRLAIIAGALRNTGTGWHVIDDTGHEPSGITGLIQQADHLEVQHAVGAVRVVSMTVTVDETYAGTGLRVGASAGKTLSRIYLYAGADGSPAVDPATVCATNGNLWISGLLQL
jgi:hypothetical protein